MNDKLKEKLKQALLENESSKESKLPEQKLPKSIFIIPGIIFIIILTGTYFLNPYSKIIKGPYGKILSPAAGSETGKQVRVVGETKNIESDQHIWLAVDKPDIGLCWPKEQITANTKFSTTIYEGGPQGIYTLSLYVLNQNFHKQWKEWQDRKIFGGLHLPPDSKRLDAVKLILKG